jgi:D-Tyr-tRNAtyr deacylase
MDYRLFEEAEGKLIKIVINNSSWEGIVVEIINFTLVLSTKMSKRHYFSLEQISHFYVIENRI